MDLMFHSQPVELVTTSTAMKSGLKAWHIWLED